MTTEEKMSKESTPIVFFALIASLIIIIFMVIFLVTELSAAKQAIIETPVSKDQSRQEKEPKMTQPKQSIPIKEEINIYNYVKMEKGSRTNHKAVKFFLKLFPTIKMLQLYSAEHIQTYVKFPKNLKEMGIDQSDIVDDKNVSNVFFYDNTILFILNSKTYNAPHWLALTAKTNSLGITHWQCQISMRDPNNLLEGCTNHKLPPNIRAN